MGRSGGCSASWPETAAGLAPLPGVPVDEPEPVPLQGDVGARDHGDSDLRHVTGLLPMPNGAVADVHDIGPVGGDSQNWTSLLTTEVTQFDCWSQRRPTQARNYAGLRD